MMTHFFKANGILYERQWFMIFTWVWLQWSKRTTKWHSKPLKGRYHHIFSKKTIMQWVSAREEHTNDTGKWLTLEIEWVNEPLEFVMSCCVSLLFQNCCEVWESVWVFRIIFQLSHSNSTNDNQPFSIKPAFTQRLLFDFEKNLFVEKR